MNAPPRARAQAWIEALTDEQARARTARWAAARAAFETGAAEIAQLAIELGVANSTVRRRAKKEGWLGYPRLADGAPPKPAVRADADRLVDIEALLDAEISALRARLSSSLADGAASSADDERRARALAGLARVLEKVMEMKNTVLEQSARSEPERSDASAEDVRAEVQRRLDRILTEEGLDPLAPEPDADGA